MKELKKTIAIVLEQFNYLHTHTHARASSAHKKDNCNDECSVCVSYKSAQIILNGTIILCNLSFFCQCVCVRQVKTTREKKKLENSSEKLH